MNMRHLRISRRNVVAGIGTVAIVLVIFGGMGIVSRFQKPPPDVASNQNAISEEISASHVSKEEPRFVDARRRMVENQLRSRDITDEKVLKVMGRVPRQRFVPENMQHLAYADRPLPIEQHQTISQPYIVALMTQTARPDSKSRALEIGTGSGYQAAVLAELCKEVYTIEIHKPLADSAQERLAALGYKNIMVRHGDGYQGWPEHAPYDLILVTAAPDHIPKALTDQLAVGGRMVIPVGSYFQVLLLLEKQENGKIRCMVVAPVLFVPMTGEAQKRTKQP